MATPGVSPLLKIIPASSNARRIAAKVARVGAVYPCSKVLTVVADMPAASAKSRIPHSKKARAALHCSRVTMPGTVFQRQH